MGMKAIPPEIEADFEEIGDQRRADRRQGNRRALHARFHPLFAATLVNHVAAPEATQPRGYVLSAQVRSGVVVNLRA